MKHLDFMTPATSALLFRGTGVLLLSMHWLLSAQNETGMVFILFLTVMGLLRWHFSFPVWTIALDVIVVITASMFWPDAWYGIAIPVFEGLRLGTLYSLLLVPMAMIMMNQMSTSLLSVLFLSILYGAGLFCWERQLEKARKEADRERRERYALEALQTDLLSANVMVSRMAELKERQRISQSLHDHVGHELTAADLAFQAFEHLWQHGDAQAESLFRQARERLSNSVLQLRETVHNTEPIHAFGIQNLESICHRLPGNLATFHAFGDSGAIEAFQWHILEQCLKEGLTNVIKHAEATNVVVTLDISPHIVRLSIQDDGVGNNHASSDGSGLRNLRMRAKFAGGSLSTNTTKGFQLICVLPLKKEMTQ
ncbi:sensor histidine kinase [Aureibacillus halotolerans]|uniref:histidine kinase n=1 Tax=Aureibacillus halotolerans TaxID=1508390 RepID=A0A4V3D5Q1_9BACI|nr:histidine kinase [Aureibacillus halotolerans]TDQ40887.1 signal transduction histidine kinase [Aureibacillus halotolerans]